MWLALVVMAAWWAVYPGGEALPAARAQSARPAAGPVIMAVAARGNHTCALTEAGGVKCWGVNWSGQLGDGTESGRLSPVDVAGLSRGVKAIAAGGDHTCALTTAGGVLCWGFNVYGQLGDDTPADYHHYRERTTPAGVAGLESGVTAIAAGGYHTCVVTTEGGVKCWGLNDHGQLGDGGGGVVCGYSGKCQLRPVDVVGLGGRVKAVAVGDWHTCALMEAGTVKCWGDNTRGQTGVSGGSECGVVEDICQLTPVEVMGLGGEVQAVAARGNSCAVMVDGGIQCWGSTGNETPTEIEGLGGAAQTVVIGNGHMCALMAGGGVKCWGFNDYGAVGNGGKGIPCGEWNEYICQPTPDEVVGLAGPAQSVIAGATHACALMVAGSVQCWGHNWLGQVGDGTTGDENEERLTPVDVVWEGQGNGPRYAIAGRVTDDEGRAVAGVVMRAGAQVAETDADGNFSLNGLFEGTYTVMPEKPDTLFRPVWREVTLPPEAVDVLFEANPRGEYAVWLPSLPAEYNCNKAVGILPLECEALVALYRSVNGENWYDQGNWLVSNTPCLWVGVECAGGYVLTVNLAKGDKLSQRDGTIPRQLADLTQLQVLNLSGSVGGEIPAELGKLVHLRVLNLMFNRLTGALPPELGNLIELREFYLSGNHFEGGIPAEFGKLAALEMLHSGFNNLSGAIPPELGNLAHVQHIYLHENALSGPIPPELGKLGELQTLVLFDNHLSGSLPPELGKLTKVERVELSQNELSGAIPAELGGMVNLRSLELGENALSGAIPPELSELDNLWTLALHDNELSGGVPRELAGMPTLYELDVSNNPLNGALPRELMETEHLHVLAFEDTGLCEPGDAAFQAWLETLSELRSTGAKCDAYRQYLPAVER